MAQPQLDRVGDYVLGEQLGEGGMGCVFAASGRDGAPVAIKLLHPSLGGNKLVKAHLLEEGRIARGVVHPNVVRTLDCGVAADGRPYLVMSRAMGTSLGVELKERGPVAMQRVRRIAMQILEGVAAIHAADLVHGDLKSDNILVDEGDRATIIDFGLARPHGTAPTWLGEDVLSGTPEYMAPEVIEGGAMTSAADIYAVGVIVYEMLTGTTPFSGGDASEILERHVTDDVVPPSLRCADRSMPVALEAVVMRALAKAPHQRHHGARHFASAIERAIPPSWVEPSRPPSPCAFSTTATTRTWEGRSSMHRRRHPSPIVLPAASADEAIEMWIARAEALVADHHLAAAADELSAAAAWLNTVSPKAPRRWCLLATLAAVHAGLDHGRRARQVASSALRAARVAGDAAGIAAAAGLLDRLASAARRSHE